MERERLNPDEYLKRLFAEQIGDKMRNRTDTIEKRMDKIISDLAYQICCGLITRKQAEVIIAKRRAKLEIIYH